MEGMECDGFFDGVDGGAADVPGGVVGECAAWVVGFDLVEEGVSVGKDFGVVRVGLPGEGVRVFAEEAAVVFGAGEGVAAEDVTDAGERAGDRADALASGPWGMV